MIQKDIVFRPPWTDKSVAQIEILLSRFSEKSLQYRSGNYVGDGRDDRDVFIGLHPIFVYIQRSVAGAGNAVFAIRQAEGVSFIPGGGFVSDAIKAFERDGITVGSNTDVNAVGLEYSYLALG